MATIPVEALKGFLKQRDKSPYLVEGSLEEWEEKNRPLTALLRKGSHYRDEFAVELEESIDSMALSPLRDSLYLLGEGSFRVRQFDIPKRKIANEFRADSEIRAMELDPTGAALFLATKGKILKVDARSMKLEGEAPLRRESLGMTSLKDGGDLCAVLQDAVPVLFPRFGRGSPIELEMDRLSSVCGSSAQWLCLLRAGEPVELIAYQLGDLKKIQALDRLRKEAGKQGFPGNLLNQITELERDLQKSRLVYRLSGGSSSEEGGLVPKLVFLGSNRVILGRRIFRFGPGITLEARFEPGPYATDERPEMRRQRSWFQFMDNIFSVSPDGLSAASGTHIYSLKSRKPIRALPVPTSVHLFSRDGRSLYLYDQNRGSLYLLENWQANTGPLQPSGPGKGGGSGRGGATPPR